MSGGPESVDASHQGAPESFHRTDPETIGRIDRWISEIHPHKCEKIVVPTCALGARYWTTAGRLVAHCIGNHEAGTDLLAHACDTLRLYNEPEIELGEAVRANEERIVNQLISDFANFDSIKGGPQAASLIAWSVSDESFRLVWGKLWDEALADRSPKTAGQVFLAAAGVESRVALAVALIRRSLLKLFELVQEELVRVLVSYEGFDEVRDASLDKFLDSDGAAAARLILAWSELLGGAPACIPRAIRILLDTDPRDPYVPVGLGLYLAMDAQSAIPLIAHWVNTEAAAYVSTGYLEYKIALVDQLPIFHELAKVALEQSVEFHSLLAWRHHRFITNADVVADWLNQNVDWREASQYAAALLVRYLSEIPKGTASLTVGLLRDLARKLHAQLGSLPESEILKRANLTDTSLPDHQTLTAIALARDVLCPSPKFDGRVVLRNIQSYPSTYRNLGGTALDREIKKGALPCCAGLYVDDLVGARSQDTSRLLKREISPDNFAHRQRFWQSIETQRERWERRFRNIEGHEIALTSGQSEKLRRDPYSWVEIRILDRLVLFFRVVPEPKGLRGLESKLPDFLVDSDDGALILEVASIGEKPGDIREASKVERGGVSKKTLLNKWRDQFNECKGEIELPIVVAIQPQWPFDLDFDLPNSLYGPEGWSITLHLPTHERVAEAMTRDVEMAFFALKGVDCISAVAGISPEDTSSGALAGELFRPTEMPRRPVHYPLWVRLRTALYGPRPGDLVSRMLQVPTIREEEAELLVDYGVDDLSFFAEGLLPYPEAMPLTRDRFDELVREARYLRNVQFSGRIADLKSAKEVDLKLLHDKGLHFIRQLLTAGKPEGFREEIWDTMQAEARQVVTSERPPNGTT